MNREKRRRQLATKCQLERLETRWLMKSSLAATVSAAPEAMVRHLSAQVEHWLNHRALAAAPLDVKQEKATLAQLVPSNLGSWGALRVLARLEAQGDHRFDPIYERISARFEHWAALHPGEARVSGLRLTPPPPPAEPEQPTRLAGAGSSPTAGSGIGPVGGVLPPSNWNPPTDSIQPLAPCNCPDANNLLPRNGGTAGGPGNPNGGGGPTGQTERENSGGSTGSSGSSSSYGGSSTSGSSGGLTGHTWHLESDSNLVTGEYFQSHTGGFYQAQGVISGVEFQYSSLQADPYPIYSAFLTTQAGSDSSLLTSIKASLTVNSVSEGSAVTYTPVSLVDGQTYLVQLQVTTVSSYATGLYPAVLSITKTKSGGMATENFTTRRWWSTDRRRRTAPVGRSRACSRSSSMPAPCP